MSLTWNIPGGQQVQFTPYQIGGRYGADAVVIGTGALRSENYVANTTGWKIDGLGNVDFNNGNFRGDISGASGTFTGAVAASSIDIGGDDSTSFHVDSAGGIWSGASIANKASAPFRVSSTGVLVATSGTFTGTLTGAIDASGATTAGGTYNGPDIGSNATIITGGQLASDNYIANTSGWAMDALGNAEFNNIEARGTVATGSTSQASVFIGVDDQSYVTFYHGGTLETPAQLFCLDQGSGTYGTFFIYGPRQNAGVSPPGMFFRSYDNGTTDSVIQLENAPLVVIDSGRFHVNIAGTEGAPAIYMNGDSDTGLYSPGANQLGITVAGNERLEFGTTHTYIRGANNSGSGAGGRIFLETENGTDIVSFDWNASAHSRMIVPAGRFDVIEEGGGTLDFRFSALGTTANAANAYVTAASGQLNRSTSSQAFKNNIENLPIRATSAVDGLRPRRFKWNDDVRGRDTKEWWHGLIVEEVAEVAPELVDWEWSEEETPVLVPVNLDLRAIVAELVQEVQDLKRQLPGPPV